MKPRIHQVLFDFDGVLAHYRHEVRIAHLAAHAGCARERVREVRFVSGLEVEYDSGRVDTATYLRRIGEGVGATIDEDAWIASRMAGSTAMDDVLTRVTALHPDVAMGVLTHGNVRVSLHRGSTADDVERFLDVLPRVVADVRKAAAFEAQVAAA